MDTEQRARLVAVRDNLATMPESAFAMETLGGARREDGVERHRDGTYRQLEEGENPCGTAACIAGRTCALFAPKTYIQDGIDKATQLLGLTAEQAARLFLGGVDMDTLKDITRDQAVQVIDGFLSTGVVAWQPAGVPKEIVNDHGFDSNGYYYEDRFYYRASLNPDHHLLSED